MSRNELARHAGTAACGAGLLLLLTLRFGWALVPLSFWFVAHSLKPGTVESPQWPAFVLSIFVIGGAVIIARTRRAERATPRL